MFSAKKMRTICAVFISVATTIAVAVPSGATTAKLTGDNVNLRTSASMKAKVITVLGKGSSLGIVSRGSKWTKVKVKGMTGYVASEYVSGSGVSASRTKHKKSSAKKVTVKKVSSKKSSKSSMKSVSSVRRWINDVNVNFRAAPSTSSKVIGSFTAGDTVTVYAKNSDWYKVKSSSGRVGYVAKQFVTSKQVKKVNTVRRKKTNRSGSIAPSGRASKLIDYAKKFRGVRYVYGGSSPKGFDCSGFVSYCYRNCLGISLPRSSSGMCASLSKVSRSNMKPGDLIFFSRGSRVYHVALYIGGGEMIHAETRAGINIDPVSSYNSTFHSVGRVLK